MEFHSIIEDFDEYEGLDDTDTFQHQDYGDQYPYKIFVGGAPGEGQYYQHGAYTNLDAASEEAEVLANFTDNNVDVVHGDIIVFTAKPDNTVYHDSMDPDCQCGCRSPQPGLHEDFDEYEGLDDEDKFGADGFITIMGRVPYEFDKNIDDERRQLIFNAAANIMTEFFGSIPLESGTAQVRAGWHLPNTTLSRLAGRMKAAMTLEFHIEFAPLPNMSAEQTAMVFRKSIKDQKYITETEFGPFEYNVIAAQ